MMWAGGSLQQPGSLRLGYGRSLKLALGHTAQLDFHASACRRPVYHSSSNLSCFLHKSEGQSRTGKKSLLFQSVQPSCAKGRKNEQSALLIFKECSGYKLQPMNR